MKKARAIDQRRVAIAFIFVSLCLLAFFTRLLPLHFSQYPFNNDSMTECGIASQFMQTGHLEVSPYSPWQDSTHNMATPAYDLLLAFASLALGTVPTDIAQVIVAIFALLTVGGIFVLASRVTGDYRSSLCAGVSAALMGTFVFTTGSAWKESLGIALFVLLLCAYLQRSAVCFRVLTFILLLLLAVVHHLVAVIAFLTMGYLLAWTWFFSLSNSSVSKKQYLDLATILPPVAIAGTYYIAFGLDRTEAFSSGIKIALFVACVGLLCAAFFGVMLLRSHSKWSFAPLVGIAFVTLLLLDNYGFIFPYKSATPQSYLILIGVSGVLVTLAWYGTELIFETRAVFRAVQIVLVIAPLTLILFAVTGGMSLFSHQVAYRTFDFFDIFVFIGIGAVLSSTSRKRAKRLNAIAIVLLICLLLSFPFGYWSGQLVGVRHDTQAYELDAMRWMSNHADDNLRIVTDERLSYLAESTIWIQKDAALPAALVDNSALPPNLYYMMEKSWVVSGVNGFPYGNFVVPMQRYLDVQIASDVIFVGGPLNDCAVIFTPSATGGFIVWGNT